MLSEPTLVMLHSKYDRVDASLSEFEEDVSRIYTVMRLLRKYLKHGHTNPRAIINNIVILYNVFGSSATYALYEEAGSNIHSYLHTCLAYMGREPVNSFDKEFLSYLIEGLAEK